MSSRYIPTPGRPLLAALLLIVSMAAQAAFAADFNGDHIDDLLFRDRSHGDHRLTLVLGERGAPPGRLRRSFVLSKSARRTRGFDVRVGDFNGDGRSDIIDRDLVSGKFNVRLMNGTRVLNTGRIAVAPEATELAAVADFTGDGRDDLLLRDPKTGIWYLYAMNGTGIRVGQSGPAGYASDRRWRLVAAADFNGDGRADLLLRNTSTLAWRMLLLDGRQVLTSGAPEFLASSADWQLRVVTDLNRDGRQDLLMRNFATGRWRAWHLDGLSALPTSAPVSITDKLAWQLQLLDDLNGDNSPDAILQRFDTDAWRVDLLAGGGRISGSGVVDRALVPEARVAGSGDFDGDGVPEVLISDPAGWQLMDVRDPSSPVFRALDLPTPRIWPLVCEPPPFRDAGTPTRPPDAGADSAFLTWLRPVTRENGEALCAHELIGYRILYSREGASRIKVADIKDPRADHKLLRKLGPGTWTFRILSIDSNGYFSQSSTGLSKTIP